MGQFSSFLQEKDLGVCEHPLSDILIAGEAAHPLPHTFHRLLQTISDLMMSLPSGSSLQQMALRYLLPLHRNTISSIKQSSNLI